MSHRGVAAINFTKRGLMVSSAVTGHRGRCLANKWQLVHLSIIREKQKQKQKRKRYCGQQEGRNSTGGRLFDWEELVGRMRGRTMGKAGSTKRHRSVPPKRQRRVLSADPGTPGQSSPITAVQLAIGGAEGAKEGKAGGRCE